MEGPCCEQHGRISITVRDIMGHIHERLIVDESIVDFLAKHLLQNMGGNRVVKGVWNTTGIREECDARNREHTHRRVRHFCQRRTKYIGGSKNVWYNSLNCGSDLLG